MLDNLILAFKFENCGSAVKMMFRLQNPPFTPTELVNAWLTGGVVLEWRMTPFRGSFEDQYHSHVFTIHAADGEILHTKIQYGYFGNQGMSVEVAAEQKKLQLFLSQNQQLNTQAPK